MNARKLTKLTEEEEEEEVMRGLRHKYDRERMIREAKHLGSDREIELWDIRRADWVVILTREIRDKYIEAKCDWNSLSGSDWVEILLNSPRYDHECDWLSLQGEHITELLRVRPELAPKCKLDRLSGPEWVRVLMDSPSLSHLCNWSLVSEKSTKMLIQRQIDREASAMRMIE